MTTSHDSRLLPHLATAAGLLIFAVAIWALVREVHSVSLVEIGHEFSAIPAKHFVLAGLFTLSSYFLLTNYDLLAMKYLGQPLQYRAIAPIAFAAFAVGHNVGIASLSGGAIRYRAYSQAGLTATQIAAIVAFIALTFAVGSTALLGITLLLEPEKALSSIPLGTATLRSLGFLLLSLPLVYLVLTSLLQKPLTLGNWSIRLPSPGIGVCQLVLAALDLVCASLVLYVLVSASTELSYPVFLGAYLLAMLMGAISAVPGAIGVFESSLLLLLPEVPTAQLLGAIVAYRLIYYLVPLVLAVGLIAAREMAEHRSRLLQLSTAGIQWGGRILPQALGAAVFLGGAYLLVRGSVPMTIRQAGPVPASTSLTLLETSHLLNSAIGAWLLLLAHGLHRRLQRAWAATAVLLVIAITAQVLLYSGYVHTLVLMAILALVWLSRAEFYRGTRLLEPQFDWSWIASIGLVLTAAVGVGLFAHKHVEYSNQLWWQFTLHGEASRMLRGGLLSIILLGAFALAKLLQTRPSHGPVPAADEMARVRALVQQSECSVANIALLGDKRILFHPAGDAFIMYQSSGRSWIALGDPVGKPERFEELLWLYREACDANAVRCVFYEVGSRYLSGYIDLGLSFFKLGEEGNVDLTGFSLEGSQRAELRQAISRAQRHGAVFSVIPASDVPNIMDQLARISSSWLEGKSASEKGFSLGYFTPEYVSNFDCAVVTVGEEIVAFANLWKGADHAELSLDLMRYTDKAPKGIMDYLFTEIMLWGKVNGYRNFSLGMAPLSGLEQRSLATGWHKFGNLVYRFGENFYNFEGLRNYKEKFEPDWQPRFLACRGGLQVPAVLLDTSLLISGGIKGVLPR